MTKRQDLCLQRRSRSEQSDQRQPNQAANISHQPRASPDSTSLASRIEFPTMTGLMLTALGRNGRVRTRMVRGSHSGIAKLWCRPFERGAEDTIPQAGRHAEITAMG